MSNVIKSTQADSAVLGGYEFRTLGHAAMAHKSAEDGGFTPMGMFDTTELEGMSPDEEAEESGPAMAVITEEELDRQLRESFQNGLIEGKNLAERGLVNVFRSLRLATEEIENLREKVLRESEDELIHLIMMVARKVIVREISINRSILSEIVKAGLAAVSEHDRITIRLNPDDYILATTGNGETLRKELITEGMQLKSDISVMPGSCLIDSELGTIDAGIDAQLDELMRRLMEERSVVVMEPESD